VLTPLPPPAGPAGKLDVTTKPKGAQVVLGGHLAGVTPLKGVLVPVGEHEVTVRMEGYAPERFVLSVAERKTTKKRLKLTPRFGQLAVTTKPAGATVQVDGQVAGKTPLGSLPLAPGTHAVVVGLDGYEREQRTAVIQAGKTAKLKLKLRATHGKLSVTSRPKGATVAVDGQVVGQTPIKALPLPLGAHEVEVTADGYAGATKVVKVKRGKTAKVKVRLKKAKRR